MVVVVVVVVEVDVVVADTAQLFADYSLDDASLRLQSMEQTQAADNEHQVAVARAQFLIVDTECAVVALAAVGRE